MRPKCSICQRADSPQIVAAYLRLLSLREVARKYGAGYKSLDRHLSECAPRMYMEEEERLFAERLKQESAELVRDLNLRRNTLRLDQRVPRPRSIVTKPAPPPRWGRRSRQQLEEHLSQRETNDERQQSTDK